MRVLSIGAEAFIIKKDGKVIKRRPVKSYRHVLLDKKIRKYRTRHEARIMEKASRFVQVPKILRVDEDEGIIEMEFVEGKKLSDWLDSFSKEKAGKICREIGRNIALLHKANIIHNDLTTSNMILFQGKVFFIDFGLAFYSQRIEDKAVDLHLLREALESKHFKRWIFYFREVLKGYSRYEEYKKIMERLKKVEERGRYKRKRHGKN